MGAFGKRAATGQRAQKATRPPPTKRIRKLRAASRLRNRMGGGG